jgi:hypothetical protein
MSLSGNENMPFHKDQKFIHDVLRHIDEVADAQRIRFVMLIDNLRRLMDKVKLAYN